MSSSGTHLFISLHLYILLFPGLCLMVVLHRLVVSIDYILEEQIKGISSLEWGRNISASWLGALLTKVSLFCLPPTMRANQAPSVVYSLLSDSLELWEDDCTNGHIVLAGKYWGSCESTLKWGWGEQNVWAAQNVWLEARKIKTRQVRGSVCCTDFKDTLWI